MQMSYIADVIATVHLCIQRHNMDYRYYTVYASCMIGRMWIAILDYCPQRYILFMAMLSICQRMKCQQRAGPTFIKPDQRNPWIKDQIKITLLPTISHLLLPNFVSCGRDKPSHMTQNLVTVGAKLWTAERFLVDPWSMDYADPVW